MSSPGEAEDAIVIDAEPCLLKPDTNGVTREPGEPEHSEDCAMGFFVPIVAEFCCSSSDCSALCR